MSNKEIEPYINLSLILIRLNFRKMTGVGFIILFAASFVLFPCQGQITSPPDGTRLIFLNGSTANITWSFDDEISTVFYRGWHFTSSDGSIDGKRLGKISDNDKPETDEDSGLSGVTIIRPATLILENVNLTYNGIYRFDLSARAGSSGSEVVVFIANAPTVTVNCSSLITVKEGDDVTCVCKGEGGNPPADVTWFKDGKQIGETGKKKKTITLSNVDKTASGRYKCVAQSHTLMDERSIEIFVYYAIPPVVISLTSTPENVVFGESVVITCEAIAVPLPSYTIIHNDTDIVSTHKTYIITVLEYSRAGSYKCIATNQLGNSSKTFSLTVAETPRTTNAPTTKKFGTGKSSSETSNRSGTEWYIVVVSLVSGIIIGIFLSYFVSCSRHKFRSKNPQSNPEPHSQPIEVDTTYQELDLTKMNKEDNYQSLRVNAASNDAANDHDSTYTELSKTRDVENNYQSLT